MSSDTPQRPAVERRELGDPRTMRAITHPVRLALLETLGLEGPLTATRASELINEPPNTCSFHLRQLAKYGFVEEAGKGPGRNRPWRLTNFGMHFTDVHEDPDARVAARALDRMLRERNLSRLQAFYDSRAEYPTDWQAVTGGSEFLLYVSPDELKALDAEVVAIVDRYQDRLAAPNLRPADSLPVQVLLFAYPIRRPSR